MKAQITQIRNAINNLSKDKVTDTWKEECGPGSKQLMALD